MRSSEMDQRGLGIRDMVQHLTGGRPFIFMIMAYDDRWELFKRISQIVAKHFDLACIRADHVKGAGYDLLAKIHLLISRSELVIADISKPSPNVYYEIGYAVGARKQPLLLVQKGTEIPTDLKGLEVVEYRYDRDGKKAFEKELVDHLRLRLSSELPLLRDMLESPVSQPAYIVSSPKYPGRHSRLSGAGLRPANLWRPPGHPGADLGLRLHVGGSQGHRSNFRAAQPPRPSGPSRQPLFNRFRKGQRPFREDAGPAPGGQRAELAFWSGPGIFL